MHVRETFPYDNAGWLLVVQLGPELPILRLHSHFLFGHSHLWLVQALLLEGIF